MILINKRTNHHHVWLSYGKLFGLGIKIDFMPPYADWKKHIEFNIDLLFIRFYYAINWERK